MTADSPKYILSWRPASVAAVMGVWTALALFSVAGRVVASQHLGRELDVSLALATSTINWYTCAVFTPLYAWMARRWPIERATWPRRVPVWLLVTAVIVPLKYVLEHAALRAWVPSAAPRGLRDMIVIGYVPETVAFWAMIAVILSVEYYDRWRHREVQTHVLGRQLAEAQLAVLSSQLRPHFLFNTLQGISTLLHRDPPAADQMLSRLSDLLRDSLRQTEAREVPLRDELATLEHYLAIQRLRFQDRLSIHVGVDDVHDAMVPPFLLQPLVENAIEHGIASHAGPGSIEINGRVDGAHLRVDVTNDGAPNGAAHARANGGVGLANTRARLAALYGATAMLTADRRPDGGFITTIVLPLRRGDAA